MLFKLVALFIQLQTAIQALLNLLIENVQLNTHVHVHAYHTYQLIDLRKGGVRYSQSLGSNPIERCVVKDNDAVCV